MAVVVGRGLLHNSAIPVLTTSIPEPLGTDMSTDFSSGASHEPVASCATAFACLLRLRSRVSDGEGGSASCRGVVEGDSLPLSRLVEFAGQLGLQAKHARSDWQGLQAIGFKDSILALLKDTNLVLLTGAQPSAGEVVAVKSKRPAPSDKRREPAFAAEGNKRVCPRASWFLPCPSRACPRPHPWPCPARPCSG